MSTRDLELMADVVERTKKFVDEAEDGGDSTLKAAMILVQCAGAVVAPLIYKSQNDVVKFAEQVIKLLSAGILKGAVTAASAPVARKHVSADRIQAMEEFWDEIQQELEAEGARLEAEG